MIMIHKILFPVDFSEVSSKIVPWVIPVARKFESELHLLFVARNLQYFDSLYVPHDTIQSLQDEIVRGGKKRVEEFARTYCADYLTCKTSVAFGDAAEEIVRYIKSEEIDLVIIGTHGRKSLDRVLFGSVADSVIKMSPAPVLSINPYRIKGLSE